MWQQNSDEIVIFISCEFKDLRTHVYWEGRLTQVIVREMILQAFPQVAV